MRTIIFLFVLFSVPLCAEAQISDYLSITSIPKQLFWENKPEQFSIKENRLTMVAGAGTEMFIAPGNTYTKNNAPKLLFRPDDDFVLSACIELSFTNKWDAGAIVFISDSLHWIKFCFEKDYTNAKRVVSVVTRGISDDCNSVEISSNKVYFKMAKAEDVYALYCSTDGVKWLLVRALQLDTKPGFKVGFLAQSPTGTKCNVAFSDIQYKAVKITDLFTCE